MTNYEVCIEGVMIIKISLRDVFADHVLNEMVVARMVKVGPIYN